MYLAAVLSAADVELTHSRRLNIKHTEHTHRSEGSRPTPRDRAHRAVQAKKNGKNGAGRS